MAAGHGLLGHLCWWRPARARRPAFRFAAQAAHFAVLQHAQQFGLRRRGHLADFIEQQRAAVGEFKTSDAPFRRARKSPALVAENLALHQRFRNRRAVDGDKGPLGARRKFVNGARDDFFAGAGLTGDEHRKRNWARPFLPGASHPAWAWKRLPVRLACRIRATASATPPVGGHPGRD